MKEHLTNKTLPPFHLELTDPNVKPIQSKVHHFTGQQEKDLSDWIHHLIDLGVIKRNMPTTWQSPIFPIAQKVNAQQKEIAKHSEEAKSSAQNQKS